MTEKQELLNSRIISMKISKSWIAGLVGIPKQNLNYQLNKANEIDEVLYNKILHVLNNFDSLKHIGFPAENYEEIKSPLNRISEVNENYNIVEEYVNPKFEQLQKDVNTLTQLYKDMLFEMKQIEKQRQNADEEFKQVIENLVEENRSLRVQFAAMAEKYNFKLNSHG